MLINKCIWFCLLFLSIISGCGVSHEVHQTVLDQLESEQKAHAVTKKDFSNTKTELETIQKQLNDRIKELSKNKGLFLAEQQAHTKTKEKLLILQNRLDETETELKSVKQQLSRANTELKSVKQQLSRANTELKSVKQQLERTNDEYKELQKIINLTIKDYFTLGRLLVNEGINEKEDRNFTKAENVFNNAIVHLRKVTVYKNKFSADAYYYIARAYYEMNDLRNALAAAIKAIEFSDGNHPDAQKIVNTIRK